MQRNMLLQSVENEKFSGDGAGNEACPLKLGQLPPKHPCLSDTTPLTGAASPSEIN